MARKERDKPLTKGPNGKALTTRAEIAAEAVRRALLITNTGNRPKLKVTLPTFSWDKKDV